MKREISKAPETKLSMLHQKFYDVRYFFVVVAKIHMLGFAIENMTKHSRKSTLNCFSAMCMMLETKYTAWSSPSIAC